MGLDIYLYKTKNIEALKEAQEKSEAFNDEAWSLHEKYEDFSDEEKEQVHAKIEQHEIELGLKPGGANYEEKIEIESEFTDHYFKIGYFRSSYNSSGINGLLNTLGIADLNEIFNFDDEYLFQPDWLASLKRVEKAIADLEQAPKYSIQELYSFGISDPNVSDSKRALEIFLEEKAKLDENPVKGFDSYSNGKGEFYMSEPLKVHAFIEGRKYNNRCVFVVVDADYDWYIKALKIVKQTIEYVIAQKDDMQYYLHWSG